MFVWNVRHTMQVQLLARRKSKPNCSVLYVAWKSSSALHQKRTVQIIIHHLTVWKIHRFVISDIIISSPAHTKTLSMVNCRFNNYVCAGICWEAIFPPSDLQWTIWGGCHSCRFYLYWFNFRITLKKGIFFFLFFFLVNVNELAQNFQSHLYCFTYPFFTFKAAFFRKIPLILTVSEVQVRMMMLKVIARTVGLHRLILLSFYPYLQKYVQVV